MSGLVQHGILVMCLDDERFLLLTSLSVVTFVLCKIWIHCLHPGFVASAARCCAARADLSAGTDCAIKPPQIPTVSSNISGRSGVMVMAA